MEPTGEPPEPEPEAEPEADSGRVNRTTRRLKAEQTRLTRRIEETRERLERSRPRSPLIDAGFRAFEHDVATGGVVLAGAVAFRIFLFLVPYVFVLVVGFGIAAEAGGQDAGDLARDAGIGGLLAQALSGAADLSGFSRVTALLVALFALFLGARALLKVLRIVYGLIWGVVPPKLGSTTKAVLAVLGLTTVAFAFAGLVDKVAEGSLVFGLLGIVVTALVPFAAGLVISVTLPRQPTRWPDLVPGALFLTAGVFVLHLVTVYWIARVIESKTDTYGAIGAALGLLLWAYLLGRLITASAVINASLWQQRQERAERRAARVRIHAASPNTRASEDYTAPALSESSSSTRIGREEPDGGTDRSV